MEIECFKLIDNSLSSDPFKHLDSDASELGEEGDTNQKKKVQKREKVKYLNLYIEKNFYLY